MCCDAKEPDARPALGSKRTKTLLVFVVVVGFQLAGSVGLSSYGFPIVQTLSQDDGGRIRISKNIHPTDCTHDLKRASSNSQFMLNVGVEFPHVKNSIEPYLGTSRNNRPPTTHDLRFHLLKSGFSPYIASHSHDGAQLHFRYDILRRRLAAVNDKKSAVGPYLIHVVATLTTGEVGSYLLLSDIPLNLIRVSSEDQTFAGLSDGSGDVVDAKSGQEGLPYSQYEQCLAPKRHVLLGTQILIGALLLAIGLYLVGKAFGEFGPVGVDAGAGYFVGGGVELSLGGCLISGIAFLEICVAIQN